MNLNTSLNRPIACALLGALSLHAGAASAAGVSAGTSIENTATATYSNGATVETVQSNNVSILVDEVLDVTVASLDAANVALTSSGAVLSFQLGNTGNGPEAFRLTLDPALSGDDFDPAVTQTAYDSNSNGLYDAGIDATIAAGGSTPAIPADGTLRIFVVTQLAGTPSDGDTAKLRLIATAVTGAGSPGTLFAGQGQGGGDAVVGTSTAEDQDDGTLVANIGAVSLTKTAAIVDRFGGTQAIPGATVTYTLLASVNGSGSVTGLTVTDPIPTGTTYQPNSLTLDSSPLTDAAADDAGQAGSSGISVDLGTVAGGSSRTVTFSVTLN